MKTRIILILILFTSRFFIYGQQIEQDVDDTIYFISTKKTLVEQLKQFEGKFIYVDFWFTSCGSCIKQFKFKKKLNKFFEDNNIATLYICFDQEKNIEKWKKIIYQYSLTGYHVFLNTRMKNEYKNNFNISRKYFDILFHMAPHFLIIDKKGNVLEEFAALPEEDEKLMQQFKKHIFTVENN